MANEEKILAFRSKSIEELEEILNDPNSTEEVLENIFGKAKLA